jgi:hypothetical protein
MRSVPAMAKKKRRGILQKIKVFFAWVQVDNWIITNE